MVPRQSGFHGPGLSVTRGTMQAGIVSQTLFNKVVDNVIRNCLAITVED